MSDIQTCTVPMTTPAPCSKAGWPRRPVTHCARSCCSCTNGAASAITCACARRADRRLGLAWLRGRRVRCRRAPTTIEDCSANMMIYVNDRDLLRARLHAASTGSAPSPASTARASRSSASASAVWRRWNSPAAAPTSNSASFHGNLSTRDPAEAQNIRCPVLACHGADDPLVTRDVVAGFERGRPASTGQSCSSAASWRWRPDPGFGTSDAGADRRAFGLRQCDDVFAWSNHPRRRRPQRLPGAGRQQPISTTPNSARCCRTSANCCVKVPRHTARHQRATAYRYRRNVAKPAIMRDRQAQYAPQSCTTCCVQTSTKTHHLVIGALLAPPILAECRPGDPRSTARSSVRRESKGRNDAGAGDRRAGRGRRKPGAAGARLQPRTDARALERRGYCSARPQGETPLSEHAMYITINDIVLNPGTPRRQRRPFEVFIAPRTWTTSSGSWR